MDTSPIAITFKFDFKTSDEKYIDLLKGFRCFLFFKTTSVD